MVIRRGARAGRGNFIDGVFGLESPSGEIKAISPANLADVIGTFAYSVSDADRAVAAARAAYPGWRRTRQAERARLLEAYADSLEARRSDLVVSIARAIGKPLWEAKTEVDAMIAKVKITLDAGMQLIAPRAIEEGTAYVRYRPIGVCAVIGPFNFPGHLPNGHFVPALATGNVVVFKPSERAPEVAELIAECMAAAGIPPGVFNVVQGDPSVARRLVANADVDAVMFTGSTHVGASILADSAKYPGRMIALELGGKNPAIVMPDADLAWAAREIAFSAYVTAGQRCTATGRVLVHRSVRDPLLERLAFAAVHAGVGAPDDADALLGPVITAASLERTLALLSASGDAFEPVVAASRAQVAGLDGHYLRPSVYALRARSAAGVLGREELFAPVLLVETFDDESEAVALANATGYGLAASVFSARHDTFDRIATELEFGICNWNRGSVGSSSKLPFGGVKNSGNHRAAGMHSVLYCVDPVAELRVPNPNATAAPIPGLRTLG